MRVEERERSLRGETTALHGRRGKRLRRHQRRRGGGRTEAQKSTSTELFHARFFPQRLRQTSGRAKAAAVSVSGYIY